jgi:signal transduction histidine kinase
MLGTGIIMPSRLTAYSGDQCCTSRVRELEAELAEILAHQAATSDVLKAISRSPAALQPVFDTIVVSAARLCGAVLGNVQLYDGRQLQVVATHNYGAAALEQFSQHYPMQPNRSQLSGRAILARELVHVCDVLSDPEYLHDFAAAGGLRAMLSVPMLREGKPVGVITVAKQEPVPFTERQMRLLQTFADQAVIAIENTRLFEEAQARTRELQQSLEYQTATGEVLNVISRSPTELQPVLDAIVATAAGLCRAEFAIIFKHHGGKYHIAAANNAEAEFIKHASEHPILPDRGSLIGRTALERKPVHLPDCLSDPEFTFLEYQRIGKYRSMLGVPLLREGVPIGVIGLMRTTVAPFTDKQIDLVMTFADQAVIAIENVRLFEEVQARTREVGRSLDELKALSEVGQAISSTLDLNAVLDAILMHACRLADSGGGAIYVFDEGRGAFDLEAAHNMSPEFIAAVRAHPIQLGDTLIGECAARRAAVQVEDLSQAPPHPLFAEYMGTGIKALLAVPLLHQHKVIGALVVRRKRVGAFSADIVGLLQSFAAQSAIAIQNARLFREIEDKSYQLELASQHKSQFLANMSHELRTPLNAVLGYAELMQDGVYGELSAKVKAVLERVQSNGKHLLGLINDVLDLAKIEAGQLTLRIEEYSMKQVVETVVTATESLAAEKRLPLAVSVPPSLPVGRGDERRIAQVLLNLVGNAIKFTDDGEIRISARADRDRFLVCVADTGPGIPLSEQGRIFEEFHQVDSSNTKKKGGTGLGLAIARRIVRLHGGRLWVESEPGRGSTFYVDLPVTATPEVGAS